MNIFLFLSFLFFGTFFLGKFIEKMRIPWVFSALLLGSVFSFFPKFFLMDNLKLISLLSDWGMYFLLFMIGFEIDLREIKKQKGKIFKITFLTVFLNAILGGVLIKIFLNYTWKISLLVGFSFATVGEAILVPILQEFKLMKTKLGQMILGIGTLDDIIEVLILGILIVLLGVNANTHFHVGTIILSLTFLFSMTYVLQHIKEQESDFRIMGIDSLFLLTIAILFLFLGVGDFADSGALGAILAGISLKTFLPKKRLSIIEKEVKAVCCGLFAPIFFFWSGVQVDFHYLFVYWRLVLVIVLVSAFAKYFGVYVIAKNNTNLKQIFLLGTAISVRFSTGIVIIKILLDNNIVNKDLYSIIIASNIIFVFLIPIIFSQFVNKWRKEIV